MTEWIPSLSARKKWFHEKNLQVNDVVLLVSPDSPRAHRPLGSVTNVYPGNDGQIRQFS